LRRKTNQIIGGKQNQTDLTAGEKRKACRLVGEGVGEKGGWKAKKASKVHSGKRPFWLT